MDDRYFTRPFRYSFNLLNDPTSAWVRFDHHTGGVEHFSPGPTHGLFEPQFVPRSRDAPEGDGYLVGIANDHSRMRSEVVIADAQRLAEGPIGRVLLPFRLHMQVHGCWVPAHELPFDSEIDPDFVGGPYV